MKKVLAFLMSLSLFSLTLAGCNSTENNGDESTAESQTTVSETSASETETSVEPVAEVDEDELLKNGTFDTSDVLPWTQFFQGGNAETSVEDGKLKVDIKKCGFVEHAVQIYQDGFRLYKNGKYQMKFDVSSTIPRQIQFRIQINGGDYHAYTMEYIDINEEVQTVTIDFEMKEETDPAPRLAFNLGLQGDVETMDPHQVYFDNISLKLVDDTNAELIQEAPAGPDVNVDQVGYISTEAKLAVFRGAALGSEFEVINADTEESVFKGKISEPKDYPSSGEDNAFGDFSDVKEPGNYYIKANDVKSYTFKIGDDVFDSAYNDVVKMLYLQRCGCELTADLAGDFAHPACHTSEAVIYGTDKKIDVTGGWHDAGDYGRYVVPGAKTVADLFLSYELNPERFGDNSGIPESGNGVPDILDEAKYELDWMLKMQDAETGGVYHKVTCANFPSMVMPQEETDELIVAPISVAATGDFAAVMAMSSRIYAKTNPEYAATCKSAAEKAWAYLEANENNTGFHNPKDIVTGQYDDPKQADERFWAAAELYKLTGDSKYRDVAVKEINASKYIPEGFGWAAVGYYGCFAYLTTPNNQLASDASYTKVKEGFLKAANGVVSYSKSDGYMNSLLPGQYGWGSNMSVANNAMLLVLANKIEANDKYVQTAREHVHYLFGRNPLSISYVTGYGTVSPVNTHHRPSEALGKTMPGMLVGGPDSKLEDPYAKNVLNGKPPAKCYADNSQSFSTNEITIYWNSPLIVAMDSMQSK